MLFNLFERIVHAVVIHFLNVIPNPTVVVLPCVLLGRVNKAALLVRNRRMELDIAAFSARFHTLHFWYGHPKKEIGTSRTHAYLFIHACSVTKRHESCV